MSFPGMVLPLGVAPQLCSIKIDVAQLARAIPSGLVVEVTGGGMAAFAAGRDGQRTHFVGEFDHGHEAVAGRAIPLLRALVGAGAERSQRAPALVGEADRKARTGVAE